MHEPEIGYQNGSASVSRANEPFGYFSVSMVRYAQDTGFSSAGGSSAGNQRLSDIRFYWDASNGLEQGSVHDFGFRVRFIKCASSGNATDIVPESTKFDWYKRTGAVSGVGVTTTGCYGGTDRASDIPAYSGRKDFQQQQNYGLRSL